MAIEDIAPIILKEADSLDMEANITFDKFKQKIDQILISLRWF